MGNKAIKALECCSNIDAKCDECVFYGNEWCRVTLAKESLRIINRLKAENKNCGDKIFNQREQLKAANEKIKVLTSEIEELKEPLMINIDGFASEYDEKIKSEAVKEFAERLKALLPYDGMSPKGVFKFGRIKSLDIDNLLKEMGCEE